MNSHPFSIKETAIRNTMPFNLVETG